MHFGEITSQLMRISDERRATKGHERESERGKAGDRDADKKLETERETSRHVYMFRTC